MTTLMRTGNSVRADDIVYMVAVIKDSGKVAGFRLLSTALEKTVDVSYNKLLTLLRNGYKVSNLCLLKDRIRAFNEHCGLGRYSQLDIRGRLVEPKMSKVVLIKGYGSSNSLLVYNNENCNIQYVPIESIQDIYNYAANLVSINDDIEVSDYEIRKISLGNSVKNIEKRKVALEEDLSLSELALLTNENNIEYEINNCLWVRKLHYSKLDRIRFGRTIHGIDNKAIERCELKELDLSNIGIIESEAIGDCKIGKLIIGPAWYVGANTINNCEISKLEIADGCYINNNLLNNCFVNEVRLCGNSPMLNNSIRKLFNNSEIKYLMLSSEIESNRYEKISSMIGSKSQIILE